MFHMEEIEKTTTKYYKYNAQLTHTKSPFAISEKQLFKETFVHLMMWSSSPRNVSN